MPIATRDAVVGLRRRARFAGAGADVPRRWVQVLGGKHPRWKASTNVGVRRRIAARARFARDEEETMAKASVAGVQLQDADASVAIRTWSACGACPPTRESWDYGVRAGEKARGKWSGRVPGVSGAASPRGGRSRTSYRSRYNYRHRYRYRRGIAASRAFRGCMQNKNQRGSLDKHHRNHREPRMWTTVGLESLTCGARPSTRAPWDWGHARGSPDPMEKNVHNSQS